MDNQPLNEPSYIKPAALPLWALVLTIVGFCIPCLLPVSIIMAIVALAKGSEPAYAARKTLAIIALALGAVYLPIAVLAAIAIPNFLSFQAKSKQSECKINLKAAYTAQKSFYAENDRFSESPKEVGFAPEANHRYLYAFNLEGGTIVPTRSDVTPGDLLDGFPQPVAATLGLEGDCPKCQVTMGCVGNVDNDDTLDVWSISTEDRVIEGEKVPAGTPFNDQNDVRE